MNYLEYSKKPKIIEDKDKNIVLFKLIFPIDKNIKDRIYFNILNYIICTTNKFYNNSKDFKKELIKHSIMSLDLSYTSKGNNFFIVYEFSLPSEGLFKNYNLEESFKYAIDNLYNPYVDKNQFNLNKFNYEKDYFYNLEKNSINNIYKRNDDIFYHIIDPKEKIVLSHKTKMKLLEKANPKELFNLYKK